MKIAVLAVCAILMAVVAGGILSRFGYGKGRLTVSEARRRLQNFAYGGGASHEWDDFITIRQRDPRTEALRLRCLDAQGPLPHVGEALAPEQVERLRKLLDELLGDEHRTG